MLLALKKGDFMEIEYSVDMIRLASSVDSRKFVELMNTYVTPNMERIVLEGYKRLKNNGSILTEEMKDILQADDLVRYKGSFLGDIEYWQMTKYSAYRHNWKVILENGESYYVACRHNTEKPNDKHKLILEFNPNKHDRNGLLNIILNHFSIDYTLIKSVDIACDLPVDISLCNFDKKLKQKFKIFGSGSPSDITYYIGNDRGSDAGSRVKIYNKQLEANLKNPLTRYEVTIKPKLKRKVYADLERTKSRVIEEDMSINEVHKWQFPSSGLPELLILDENKLADLFLDWQSRVFILGLQQSPESFNQMSKYQKDKWKKKLDLEVFQPDFKYIKQALQSFINTWFYGEKPKKIKEVF